MKLKKLKIFGKHKNKFYQKNKKVKERKKSLIYIYLKYGKNYFVFLIHI